MKKISRSAKQILVQAGRQKLQSFTSALVHGARHKSHNTRLISQASVRSRFMFYDFLFDFWITPKFCLHCFPTRDCLTTFSSACRSLLSKRCSPIRQRCLRISAQSMFQPSLRFPSPPPFFVFHLSLGLCHLLSLPVLLSFSSFAHPSATIEAIEAIETVKDAEGKIPLISLCGRVCYMCVCVCVRVRTCVQHGCALSRPCS